MALMYSGLAHEYVRAECAMQHVFEMLTDIEHSRSHSPAVLAALDDLQQRAATYRRQFAQKADEHARSEPATTRK